jgi:hypothetical protein
MRIAELLDEIKEWQVILEVNKDGIETEEEFAKFIYGEATLAIMKAKLTALQGE